MNYKIIDHTADLAVEFYGKTIAELFENSAVSLSEIIYEKKMSVSEDKNFKLNLTSDNIEVNYIDFLREILYNINQNFYYFYKCKATLLSETSLSIKCWYSKFKKDDINNEIKAVTYHECEIKSKVIYGHKMYYAKVTFDI
ncbi:MAG TPA: archease [Candidatus Cloacimonetes bacterium]|nr:archease [Candidatus Cloacimonadota bacterium]